MREPVTDKRVFKVREEYRSVSLLRFRKNRQKILCYKLIFYSFLQIQVSKFELLKKRPCGVTLSESEIWNADFFKAKQFSKTTLWRSTMENKQKFTFSWRKS